MSSGATRNRLAAKEPTVPQAIRTLLQGDQVPTLVQDFALELHIRMRYLIGETGGLPGVTRPQSRLSGCPFRQQGDESNHPESLTITNPHPHAYSDGSPLDRMDCFYFHSNLTEFTMVSQFLISSLSARSAEQEILHLLL